MQKFTTALLAPTAIAPVNNATNQPDALTLSWNPVGSAASYGIQVSTDSSFATSIFLSQAGLSSTSLQVSGLNSNTAYFWRVNATNLGGTSAWSLPWNFTTIVSVPASPMLIQPVNNAAGQPVSIQLKWNAVSPASSYGVQVSTDSTFAGSIIYGQSGLTSTTQLFNGLTNNTVYYWRVNATNLAGTSPWSPADKFITVISAPALSVPANAAVNQPLSLTASWNPVASATSYALQVSTDSTFATSIAFSQGGITATNQTVGGLLNGTKYFWRVEATNTGGPSEWSSIYSFSTLILGPSLVSPPNNALNQPVSPTLSWHAAEKVLSYTLKIATDSTFSRSIAYNQNDITGTSLAVSGLANSTLFFWQVTAIDSNGISALSPIYSFTTLLSPPVLVFPASGAVNQPYNVSLSWDSVPTAISYAVKVATDQAFTNIIFNQTGLTTTSQSVDNLAHKTTYYWRTNATNAGGTSDWSATNNFMTAVLLAPVQVAPVESATNQPMSPAFSWDSVAAATSYSLEVSTDSSFMDTSAYSKSGIVATSQAVTLLGHDQVYYWRVNAAGPLGTGVWSATHDFTTIPEPEKGCGCGAGTGIAFMPPLWFKWRVFRKRRVVRKIG